MDPLTNEDVADILALLDSLPYGEFDLETPRFRLTLRRTPGGWTQSTQVLSAPEPADSRDRQVGAYQIRAGGKRELLDQAIDAMCAGGEGQVQCAFVRGQE